MYRIIALIGKAGSGKDTLMRRVLDSAPRVHEIVSCTTRPIRENEVDGVNYHYLTVEEFENKAKNGEMLEVSYFNDWYYGTSYDSLSDTEVNIGVFNPTGVRSLMRHKDIDLTVYYIVVDDKERLLRQLNREAHPNVPEIIRRYKADKEDFENLSDIPYIGLPNDKAIDLSLNTMRISDDL